MDVVAIWSIAATAFIGALGVIVPAVTKRGDRQHESDLEKERAALASAAWVREHQASAYERLVKAMDVNNR